MPERLGRGLWRAPSLQWHSGFALCGSRGPRSPFEHRPCGAQQLALVGAASQVWHIQRNTFIFRLCLQLCWGVRTEAAVLQEAEGAVPVLPPVLTVPSLPFPSAQESP